MNNLNMIIANNIMMILKKQNKKQTDLAAALNTSKQTVNKMLNGYRMINAMELKIIAEYLNVSMEYLTRISNPVAETNIIHVFMGRISTEEAYQAIKIADKLSDMILFHNRVKAKGEKMLKEWDE